MDGIKKIIRQFISKEFLPGEPVENLKDDTPLIELGVLDSLGTIKLVNFLEKTFSIQIDSPDLAPKNFENLNQLEVLVRQLSKLGPQ